MPSEYLKLEPYKGKYPCAWCKGTGFAGLLVEIVSYRHCPATIKSPELDAAVEARVPSSKLAELKRCSQCGGTGGMEAAYHKRGLK